MAEQCVHLDGQLLWAGLEKAALHTLTSPLLCLLRGQICKLAVVSDRRLVVSWQTHRLPSEQGDTFFLIPNDIVQALSRPEFHTPLEARLNGQDISLASRQNPEALLQWSSDPRRLDAPPQFGDMLLPPRQTMEVDYVPFSEALHRAVSRLVTKEAEENVYRNKLAILFSFHNGGITIDGEEITSGLPDRLYFDPRLIIRSLEFLTCPKIGLGLTPLGLGQRAILFLSSTEGAWTTHCALLSIGLDTQKLYPLPPVHPQDTPSANE